MSARLLVSLAFLLAACGGDSRPSAPSPACEQGLTNIREGWGGLDARIRESLESTSWCFKTPTELRAVLGRAVTELERLQQTQPGDKPISAITDDPGWTQALADLRAQHALELGIARELECPDTAMLLAFRTAQQILDATKPDAAPALTLLDEQRNPVQMPWTPRVLRLAVADAPSRVDAMVTSSAVQRDRSARLRTQVEALTRALEGDPAEARAKLDAIDDSLVPILHTQIGQAKATTASWLAQCRAAR